MVNGPLAKLRRSAVSAYAVPLHYKNSTIAVCLRIPKDKVKQASALL